jgi:ATP-dependent Lon protease
MVEYLEITLLITAIIVVFRQTHDRIKKTEEQSKDIESKLEATYKLLKELQLKNGVSTEIQEKIEFKKKQHKLLEDMMSADEELGLYDINDTQYEGTEHDGANRLTEEQVQEILENIKYRKANKLK